MTQSMVLVSVLVELIIIALSFFLSFFQVAPLCLGRAGACVVAVRL